MATPNSQLPTPKSEVVTGARNQELGVGGRKSGVEAEPLVNLQEIAEIELFIVKRMKEFTVGDHASVFKGGGFNFVGVRDWQPGDRTSHIDWAQSSMTNFSPMITRDFEQDSNATIIAVADASLSTRCGVHGVPIAAAIARAVAAAGLSAMFFQDLFGLVTFDDRFEEVTVARPKIGRSHLLYCLDLYQAGGRTAPAEGARGGQIPGPGRLDKSRDIIIAIESQVRKSSLIPVISDFLFPDAVRIIGELALLNAVHDVFLLMADVRFAYELPPVSDGWIEAYDVETGKSRVFSRRELRRLAARVGEWQDDIERTARDAGIDVVRVGLDRWQMETALVEFTAERRLRKM
jgi:uncharacterized protein (DUF58 family)